MVQSCVSVFLCVSVWDFVYACFKDPYSVTLAQTTQARKTKQNVFVLEQRDLASLQAVELQTCSGSQRDRHRGRTLNSIPIHFDRRSLEGWNENGKI